jgi:fibro-slime domain-containing protein
LESHLAFVYKGFEEFEIASDDDSWVLINDKLVIDLGGLHGITGEKVSLPDLVTKGVLDIKIGDTVDLDVFFMERQTGNSELYIKTNLVLFDKPAPSGVAPVITTGALANGAVSTPFSQTLTATGDAPITWSLTGGALPNGLTLAPGGVISGTPTADGVFTFTVKAENTAGSDSKQLSITIEPKVVTDYNLTVYMQTAQAGLKAGDTLLVDVMLSGDLLYTRVESKIAYDTALLEFAGYAELAGWVAECKKEAPDKVALNSVPSMNLFLGAPCTPPVKLVTLKFTVKNDFTQTDLSFAYILVTSIVGVNSTTAPGNTLTVKGQ